LYDLETDPGENNDLAGDATHSEIEKKLHKIAQERCKEIRNSLVK
jgi:hypothetical protein